MPIGYSAILLPQLAEENGTMYADRQLGSWIGTYLFQNTFLNYVLWYLITLDFVTSCTCTYYEARRWIAISNNTNRCHTSPAVLQSRRFLSLQSPVCIPLSYLIFSTDFHFSENYHHRYFGYSVRSAELATCAVHSRRWSASKSLRCLSLEFSVWSRCVFFGIVDLLRTEL